jgi:hypothetical protein
MANPVRRRATYEDILAAPEHMVAEILDETSSCRRVQRRFTPRRSRR